LLFTGASLFGSPSIIRTAEEKKLYNHPLWLLLLEYEDGESKIDDPNFFVSPRGKKDPKDELFTFIKLIQKDPSIACKYPARAYFLKKYLPLEITVECADVEEFLKEVDGSNLSIIFADSHINSPASMFGHTFLRIYRKEKDLTSYIANYAAYPEDTFGPLYAFKGIFGFYKGYYTIAPFYMKIREYSAIEGRDLWEYEIDISEENLHILKLHLFELKNAYAYYYFFQENCSTNVFYLLNFANPEDRLEVGTFWVIPVDTLKVIMNKGLVKNIRYEPSLLRKLNAMAEAMDYEDIEIIKKWTEGRVRLPDDKDPIFYEFASLYVRFLYYRRSISRKYYRRKFLEALRKRSKKASEVSLKIKKPVPPHLSHGSQRIYVSYGYKNGKYLEFSYRPAYHDLLDPVGGYRRNSEIVFSEFVFRYEYASDRLWLQRWKGIRIVSLEPASRIVRPVSWKVDFGVERIGVKYGPYINTGGGYTFDFRGVSFFLLPEIYISAVYPSLSAGGHGGILSQGNTASFLLSLKGGTEYTRKGSQGYGNMEIALNISIARNLSMRAYGNYGVKGSTSKWEVNLGTFVYF